MIRIFLRITKLQGFVFSLMFAGLVLSGCGSVPSQKINAPTIGHYIDHQTAFVRNEVKDAYLYPGVLGGYAKNSVQLRHPSTATDVLLKVVNASWQGPIDELTTSIGAETGFQVRANGEKPGSPILVSVNLYHLPAIGLLREAYMQTKGRARLVIDQRRGVMTIHYARKERSPIPHKEDLEP